MKLFQMKPAQAGKHRMASFLDDNFVCAGVAGIGDLEHVSQVELVARLAQLYGPENAELGRRVEELGCFVHDMQDGDYILIADGDAVHLGDLGDYYYVDRYDNEEDGGCHRRGVTWLKGYDRSEMREELLPFLEEPHSVSRYGKPVSKEQLASWLVRTTSMDRSSQNEGSSAVPAHLVGEALSILEAAMRSDDADRRVRAAIAILQYAGQSNLNG
ncbi:hypothetical protein [Paenibacillus harenae]|uniref:Mrr-cat superfamily restriction endonuclease n=1 Tax=Paenibacillus harenae TaxID=306543 RepID=A0ABT9U576_PAEHA|nr:hypothetical protein [Paenibacillus harenae]MDQ0114778.1 putative Mrr-cat superfamily restriction endonuclease [Paenibacillus harenae]